MTTSATTTTPRRVAGTVRALVRPWRPSMRVIKGPRSDGWKYTCDNEGCAAQGKYVFEEGNGVWTACQDCKPAWVLVLAELKPNAQIEARRE